MPPTLQALQYDDLPEGSLLRRQCEGNGGVTITAPRVAELPLAVRRTLTWNTALSAAYACATVATILGVILLVLVRMHRLDPRLRLAAVVTTGVLVAGIFLFAWSCEYSLRASAFSYARRVSTVLYADAQRVLVETALYDEPHSVGVRVADVAALRVVREPPAGAAELRPVPCLKLVRHDGTWVHLLEGYMEAELCWAASAIRSATGIAPDAGPAPNFSFIPRRFAVCRRGGGEL